MNKSTTYTYGNRNQMTQNSGYYLEGTTDTGQMDFTYDDKGNMTGRDWGAFDVSYTWNADNRLTKVDTVESSEASTAVDYHYNAAGERILRRGPYDGMVENPPKVRQRFFFRGLTEEVTKQSVPGAHADSAFEYDYFEDGNSGTDWGSSGSGTTISSVTDTARRSGVIKCETTAKRTFYVGDKSGTGHNPNGDPWNSTKRVLSFWHKGNATQVIVYLTASSGEKTIKYFEGPGTNGNDGNGNVEFYLNDGFAFDTDDWMRFERNIEADYEAHAGGASWTNTDGLGFPLSSVGLIHEDDIRLSDSLTVEHNTLGPGVIGHILRHTTWDAGTHARTDRWFHYDQVGTIIATTDEGGSAADTNWFDAFGNRQEDWESGLLAPAGGWGLHSKNRDPLAGMHYMSQRWYAPDLWVFVSEAPTSAIEEGRFSFAEGVPVSLVDPDGRMPTVWEGEGIRVLQNITDHGPPHFEVFCDSGHFKVGQNLKPIQEGARLPGPVTKALDKVKPQLRKHMKKVMKARRGTPKGVIGRGGGVEMAILLCVMAGEAAAEQVDQKIVQPTVTRGQRGGLGDVTHVGHGAGNAAYDLVPFE